jgi:hypothetical protein
MDGPLLDLADPAVRRMIKLAKRRGYVTRDELDEILPPDEFSPEQIEDVISQLSELHIDVVEREDNARAVYQNLARELRSFAAGQRGQGRELLEHAAKALDIHADELWSPYQPGSWIQPEQRWFLVFDAQHGIQVAEHEPSGDWTAQGGQNLIQVTHWRRLPPPP